MKLPKRLDFQLRLLPALCVAGGLLLVMKLASIGAAIGAAAVPAAQAQAPAAAPAAPATPAPAAPTKLAAAPAAIPPAAPEPAPSNLPRRDGDDSEMGALSALSERRAEIDRRADEVQQREVLLKATEQRINEKIAKLQALEKTIDERAKQRDDEEEARLKSLVKIYETMKPKDAARILDELELPVLLKVLERMKEAKSAPILASMEPAKAKQATVALAEKKTVSAAQ